MDGRPRLARRRARERSGGGGKEGGARGVAAAAAREIQPATDDENLLSSPILCSISALLLLHGIVGAALSGENLLMLWDIEPLLALPRMLFLLLSAGLGLAGLLAASCCCRGSQHTAAPPATGKVASMTLDELLAATHEYGKDLPEGVREVASHYEAHYPKHIVGQVGPVGAAASIASALNVLNDLEGPERLRVRDAMRVYRLMFEDKQAEALSKLAKVTKTSHVAAAKELFYEQAICIAARGRNGRRFLQLLGEAANEALEAAEVGSERHKLMSEIMLAVAAPEKPACALVIDRLKRLAKAEWAVAKLEGRWPLPSGAVLPSTAPIGNDSLRTAAKALAQHWAVSLRGVAAVRVQGLMGLDAKCRMVVSRQDSAEQIAAQWEELKLAIQDDKRVVLFHLHNHYALVSAWRELAVDRLVQAPAPAATRGGGAGGAGEAGDRGKIGVPVVGKGGEEGEEGEGGVKSKVGGLGEVGGSEGVGGMGGAGAAGAAGASVDMAQRRQVLTARLGQTQLHWVDFDGAYSV
jgi:hypothetical protein